PAKLLFPAKASDVPSGAALCAILDDSDQAGALGYHDLTASGQPLGKVFARTDQKYGLDVAVTLSHELIEMLGDPWINLVVENADSSRGYIRELCDAVEDDRLAYEIDGVKVSSCVYPTWFNPSAPKGVKFDHGGVLSGPFTLAPGGYIGYQDLRAGAWHQ